jgi:hypothetical protein
VDSDRIHNHIAVWFLFIYIFFEKQKGMDCAIQSLRRNAQQANKVKLKVPTSRWWLQIEIRSTYVVVD